MWMTLLWLIVAPVPGSDDALAMQGHEKWITSQHAPNGQWCCDLSDGRPAEVRGNSPNLQVYYSKEHWKDGTDQWIDVPTSAILPQPSPILLPIAWIMYGHVYCIALPSSS